jgi:hypothetical protein
MAGSVTIPGQFDDATLDGGSPSTVPASAIAGPGHCAHKTAAQDAEDGARELRARMEAMDPALVAELVRARQSAAGICAAFPAGDMRFASLDSDDEDEDGSDAGAYGDDGDDGGPEESEGELCQGLLDGSMDSGPLAALARAAREHGLDLVALMDGACLDFLARIRLANFVRSRVGEGVSVEKVKADVSEAIKVGMDAGVLADDSYLQPVIPGDVLLTALESSLSDDDGDVAAAVHRGLELSGEYDSVSLQK